MPFPIIPIIIGGAAAGAAAVAAISALLKEGDEKPAPKPTSSSSKRISAPTVSVEQSRAQTAKLERDLTIKRLRLRRNQEARQLAKEHDIPIPSWDPPPFRSAPPHPLFELLETKAKARATSLRNELEPLNKELHTLESLRRRGRTLMR